MTKETKTERVVYKECPICGVVTNYIYRIEDQHGNKSTWYRCPNGVIFQDKLPEYIQKQQMLPRTIDFESKEDSILGTDLQKMHAAHLYANLIEDMMFGRFMLQVGFCRTADILKHFENRGWLVWGIDDRDFEPGGNLYHGDFISYDFTLRTNTKEIKEQVGEIDDIERKFDLIWIEHHLERVVDPLKTLEKAVSMLTDTGVLYVSVPDYEFIHKRGVSGWNYWDKKTNYIFWSKRAIVREIEKLGLDVVVCRRNFASRTFDWDDVQIVAQKKYF